MSIGTPPTWNIWDVPPFPVRRFTVDEYHRMIETGLLTEDDPVELLEGWIVPKMPRNPPHDATIDQAQEILRGRLPPAWRIRVQSAITIPDSEPEPDIVLVPGPANRYHSRHPGPQDIAVLIEVANTTLARDRGEKARLYARAGIPVYWILNLTDSLVEVYSDPSGSASSYLHRHDYRLGEAVPLVLEGWDVGPIPVRDLLP